MEFCVPDVVAHMNKASQIKEKTDVEFIVSHYCGTDVVFVFTDLLRYAIRAKSCNWIIWSLLCGYVVERASVGI